jgi:hypothetical protein
MRPLSHHIHKVKAQPHHIRKRVAFASAFIAAAFVGVIWAGASLATGAFALKDTSSFATSAGDTAGVAVSGSGAPSADGLAAAAAATDPSSQPASIEIVDAKPAPAPAAQPTSIPF